MSIKLRSIAAISLFAAAAILIAIVIRRSQGPTTASSIERVRRPVVLVTFDTTRVDRLQPYGATNVATPTLQRLAERGVVFEQAIAVAPITLVAHTSIHTGLYPFTHGVRNNGIQYVPDEVTTLAERLKSEGYRTGAFVSAAVLEHRYGLAQGFEVYDDDLSSGRDRRPRSVPDRPAEATVQAAFKWLDTLGEGEEFFLWVHFYDPHAAYSPPPPFRDDYRERLYDGEIAYADSQLGQLLKHPRLRGSGDAEPIISVMADHGESLGEHGEQTHAILAYDSTLHIPWIMTVPGGPNGSRITETVGQVDYTPTMLAALGLAADPKIAGRDLLGIIEGTPSAAPRTYYSETYLPFYTYGWAKLRALRRGPWKLIEAPTPELYNLSRDPRELSSVYSAQPGPAHDLDRDLKELLAEAGGDDKEASLDVDPEALEKLRSLGYLAAGSGPPARLVRPNPMEVIELHVGLERARTLLQDRLYEAATKQLRTVLQRDPENLAALVDLANALEGQGEVDQAIETIERALSLDPDYDRLYVSLASLEGQRGNLDKALELVELAVAKNPGNPDTALHRIIILSRLGRRAETKQRLDEALAKFPDHPRLDATYARLVEMAEGNLEAAEARLRRVVERDPFLTNGWAVLGQLLERTERRGEAVEAYRSGLARQTDDIELHASLGQLLARTGERAQAEQHLREAIRLSTRFRPDLHVGLGALYAESSRFAEAQQEYDLVLEVAPKHPGARNNAAIALFRRGRLDEAQTMLEGLIADQPNMPDAHNNLAAIAAEKRDWKAVERYARRTLELDPKLIEAWNNLGIALEEQGQIDEAQNAYRHATTLDSRYWQADVNLGMLLARVGKHDEAAAALQRVLEVVPTMAEAHYQLGELYAGELRQNDRARAHWNAFIKYAPQDPRARRVRDRLAGLPNTQSER